MAGRVIRALRLDPTLYREVVAPDSGTWPAAAVIVITAAVSRISWGAVRLVDSVGSDTVGMDFGAAVAQSAIPAAAVSALAYLLAWPVWATGLWVLGMRWTPAERPQPWFGQIARALAYAQAPAVLGVLYVLLVAVVAFARGPEGLRSGVLWVTEFWLFALIGAWVLAATFLAVREALGLSNMRTLVALVAGGLVIAVFLGFVVVLLTGIVGRDFVGLRNNYDLGFRDHGASALDFAVGLDFNLRFIGRSDTVLLILSESVLHPFAGIGDP
ncbi:MAG: hypothetical protein F4Y02_14945 [Chloroflexi bacterium]|nr:hypothetical protein [Chloroflexota bacterium]